MSNEMKVLARKLTSLFLSVALVVGLIPTTIQAETTNEFSFEILDCVDTYYEGFNDNVAVASGTFIELNNSGEYYQMQVDKDLLKEDSVGYTEEITVNGSDMATAQIVYEEGSVYIKVLYNEEVIYREVLYTPNYVSISEMPTISLGQEVTVADGIEKYCEQYYRIDETSVTASNGYKVYTLAVEDEEDESDTEIFLYDENGTLLDENDDSEGEEDDIDSSLMFVMPETGSRIVGVRGYEYWPLTTATLKLGGGANSVVSFESDNIDSLNVFYEGFNDDLLYATGTRIQATLDNGVVNDWTAEGQYYDDEDDEDGEDDVDILFGDVQASLYRGNDGAVYADYGLSYETSLNTKKLFTPVIKPVTDIPVITEGTTTINTLEWSGANSFYRITAEEDEVWNLSFSCAGDETADDELYIDVYSSDGTYLYYEEQLLNDETEELEDLEMEVVVAAGSTIILGLSDWGEESQEYTLIATKQSDGEEPTTPGDSTGEETTTPGDSTSGDQDGETTTPEQPSSDSNETTTPAPTTTVIVEPTSVAPTTVAPTTTAKKKVTRPARAKVKKATKKKAAKRVKLSLKKVKGAVGYRVQFSKKRKFTKKNILVTKIVRKAKVTIKNKKLKKAKKLFVRVKAYKLDGKKKIYSKKWSKVKRVKIKK